MKKLALAAAIALSASSAFAGGMAAPTMPLEVVVADTKASSSGGVIIPLLILLVVAAAIASN